MAILLTTHPAPGGPGIPPRWTHSDKDGVGTAYSSLSEVWFTLSRGILNEVYYPTIDRPQVRDLQFLITDGKTFFHEERTLGCTYEHLDRRALGFRVTSSDPQGRYRIVKEVIGAPHHACVLLSARLEADPTLLPDLRLFVLLAPHLEDGGMGNEGAVARTSAGEVLTAHRGGTWLAMGATVPFAARSCGYAGTTDGWQDLTSNFQMDWHYDCAGPGNIALLGELDLSRGTDLVLGLAFGDSLNHALVTLTQTLGIPFAEHRTGFIRQWQHTGQHLRKGMEQVTGDGGRLVRLSNSLLLAHEDKRFDGALIASLSIPWGEVKGGADLGGYHLVWTRDLFNSATGLLAAGEFAPPLRALMYLSCVQRDDGGFYQNVWINGEPYSCGVQLDETAFPILLAWHLREAQALKDFDPHPMVMRAAGYLVRNGPRTAQDRWEENGGYSPSTLAACIAGLVCAASFARKRGQEPDARYLEEYADFLERHVESWTVTTRGTLVPGISRHFIRIHPVPGDDPQPDEDANHGTLSIPNLPPGAPASFPGREIVDAGFLELVRYGIRRPDDPLVEDSLRVVDAVLKVDTPLGPCWRRYNHDGYGQRADGGPFVKWGYGHAWPVLTGERGHHELAAGRDVSPFLRAMEAFATATGLIPEQVWSLPDRPEAFMWCGRPTGGAMPLVWAHGEYIKLVRSAADGRVFNLIPEVAERYRRPRQSGPLEIWQFNRQVRSVAPGGTLRIQAVQPFRLRFTQDEWRHCTDAASTPTELGAHFVDVHMPDGQRAPARFTFLWTGTGSWEGGDFCVGIEEQAGA